MKKQEPTPIQICPNCGRPVKAADFFSKNWVTPGQASMNSFFTCLKCGYYGIPIEVLESDLKSITFANKPMGRPVIQKMNWLSYLMLLGVLGWILFFAVYAFPLVVALIVLVAIWTAIGIIRRI